MALLAAVLRSATVRCITPVDLLALPRTDFLDLMGRESSLQRVVEEKLAVRYATLAANASGRDNRGAGGLHQEPL